MVLQFSLVAQLSDYDTKKHGNIVEHIIWVISELSWSAQNSESHWSYIHITLK